MIGLHAFVGGPAIHKHKAVKNIERVRVLLVKGERSTQRLIAE